MSNPEEAAQVGRGDARPHSEDDEATDERGRRWYHLRPKPRRRGDLMGFNSMLWMVVVWLLVVVVAVFPFPWWW
jgi:hypothetical protein